MQNTIVFGEMILSNLSSNNSFTWLITKLKLTTWSTEILCLKTKTNLLRPLLTIAIRLSIWGTGQGRLVVVVVVVVTGVLLRLGDTDNNGGVWVVHSLAWSLDLLSSSFFFGYKPITKDKNHKMNTLSLNTKNTEKTTLWLEIPTSSWTNLILD